MEKQRRVKFFSQNGNGDKLYLNEMEKEINAWLVDNPNISIERRETDMASTGIANYGRDHHIIVTIWYVAVFVMLTAGLLVVVF